MLTRHNRFYILGLMFVGLLVRSDDPRLLGASSGDSSASPFVLIGEYAGLTGFNHFINFVIVVSVMSIGVSGVYGGSRTLTALAQQGYAPKVFTYIDRAGRPTFSVGVILVCGLLAYINLNANGEVIFDWLVSLSGLATLFTWGSICLSHIRFRKAWAYHGHSVDEIPFQAIGGVWGSWLGLILNILVLAATVSTSSRMLHARIRSLTTLLHVDVQRYLPTRSRGLWYRRGLLQRHACSACRHRLLDHWLPVEGQGLAADC